MNPRGLAQSMAEAEAERQKEANYNEAIELLQYFVNRVEEGTIRSKVTYGKYKAFLSKIEK